MKNTQCTYGATEHSLRVGIFRDITLKRCGAGCAGVPRGGHRYRPNPATHDARAVTWCLGQAGGRPSLPPHSLSLSRALFLSRWGNTRSCTTVGPCIHNAPTTRGAVHGAHGNTVSSAKTVHPVWNQAWQEKQAQRPNTHAPELAPPPVCPGTGAAAASVSTAATNNLLLRDPVITWVALRFECTPYSRVAL